MKAVITDHRSLRDRDRITAEKNESATISFGMVPTGDDQRPAASLDLLNSDSADLHGTQPPRSERLSIRAQNVLKILSVELTGEAPPPGRWVPPDLLLQRLTYKHLATARNCGPHTTAEIVNWARAKGMNIGRSFHAGKPLSAIWQEAIAKFSTGEISKIEVAEVLEKSTRRRNTRIPVAFQRILLRLVESSNQ